MKNLTSTLILSAAVAFTLISLHQLLLGNFGQNYWLFMLTFGLFMWYLLRKKNADKANN